jgi:hypothetical protein
VSLSTGGQARADAGRVRRQAGYFFDQYRAAVDMFGRLAACCVAGARRFCSTRWRWVFSRIAWHGPPSSALSSRGFR